MKIKDLETLNIGDTIYSFFGNKFYIYRVTNINIPVHEITVCIEYIDNIENGKDYSIIDIPTEERFNNIRYGYEFTMMDLGLNKAYQNYSEYINTQINRLNGLRSNMKGLKRQYMLSKNMIPEHEKTWKELGYKSADAYNEYLAELGDDFRHGYIG